jgi:DNA mismatch repair protein MutS
VIQELDTIQNQIADIEKQMEDQRCKYNSKFDTNKNDKYDFVKLTYTDMEGYSFTCTKIRYQTLLQKMKNENDDSYTYFKIKQNNNVVKFSTDELIKLSHHLISNRELLNKKINIHYLNTLKNFYYQYYELFTHLKVFIEKLDVVHSNFICKIKNNYIKPHVQNSTISFVEAIEIRHPIIEKLTSTTYVTNDILLNSGANTSNGPDISGILLYGLNSCGKSTILRAIGVCVILAQAGLFVPCKSFTFSPFHTIISQVDSHDDMNKGVSSFINECIGIKKILQCSGKNTLCIADELTKGTEQNSGTSILASIILKLIENDTKFFFTSHLHTVPTIKEIKEQTKLQISHLSVLIKDNNIIFERKIKPDSGPTLYGLEVCSNILKDFPSFVDTAFKIRNQITNTKTTILSTKKSKYNTKKILDSCQICNNKEQLETHHIEFQCNTDEKGFVKNKHFHKNEIFNLACLCKECHDKITYNKIICYGYKDSINGKFLDWEDNSF